MIQMIEKKYKSYPVQVKASFWFLVSAFFQKGISFITTPIFTRILTTSEYGQYNVFRSWFSILSVIVTLNLYCGVYTSGLVRFENRREEYTSALQGLTLTLILGWTAIYLMFHRKWNIMFSLTTQQMLLMFVTMWTTVVFSFWSMEQRVDFKYRKLVLVTIIISIVKPIISVLLVVVSTDKVTARIAGVASVELICYIWFFLSHMKKGRTFFSAEIWRYALAFNLPLIPHYLSSSVLSGADRIMIKKMVSDSAAGIYGLAYSISMIMTIFNTALLQTIEPWLYKKIKKGRIEDISKVAYPAFIIIATTNIMLISFAPEVVRLFAPVEYYDAIYVIPPAAMSVFFMFSYTFFAVFEFYYGKTKQIAVATSLGAVLNILLNYIFINRYGYIAAGYTTLICYIVYTAFHFLFMKRICKERYSDLQPYDTKIYLIISSIFLLFGFIILSSYKTTLIRYGLILVVTTLVIIKRKAIGLTISKLISLRKEE